MKPASHAGRRLAAAALLLVGPPRLSAATPLTDLAPAANLTFALIPKNTGNDFFSVARDGCVARAAILTAEDDREVTCLYIGPEEDDAAVQAGIVNALVDGTHGRIDGISVSVSDADVLTPAIDRAVAAGIPVITFDSDAKDSSRRAYIGTDNYAFGVELGKVLDQLAPRGGRYGVLAGVAPNVVQRVEGVRARLAQSKWVEVDSSWKDCDDSIARALEIMYEFAKEGVNAVVPVGGWPMYDGAGWKDFVDQHRNLTLVVGDTLPVQMDLMNKGYVDGLVGQLPFQMGEQSVDILLDLSRGVAVDEQIRGTAFLEVMRFPLELPPLKVDENYLGRLGILGYAVFALVAIVALGLMVWVYAKRATRVVNASQPLFLHMILVGVLVFASAIVPLTIDDQEGKRSQEATDAACMAVPWLMTIGFTTIFSALFAKTWRINQLLNSTNQFKFIKVTEKDVMTPYAIMMALNVIVLSCWTAISPLTYQRFAEEGTDDWNRAIATYGVCTTMSETKSTWDFLPYLLVLLIINISLLVLANVQSYRARSVRTELSESKYITVIMLSMLQAIVLGVPCICLLWNKPREYYIVMVLLIFLFSVAVIGFLFFPKIYALTWPKEEEKTDEGGITHGAARSSVVHSSPMQGNIVQTSDVRGSSVEEEKEEERVDDNVRTYVPKNVDEEANADTLGPDRDNDANIQELDEALGENEKLRADIKKLREQLSAAEK